MTPRKQLPLEEKLIDSTTLPLCEHCIPDRTTESYCHVFHTKKHRWHSKKLMTVYVELTNLVQNLEIDFEDIIDQR